MLNSYKHSSPSSYVLENKTAAVFCTLSGHNSPPGTKGVENVKIKTLVNNKKKKREDRNGKSQTVISAAADGMLHCKLNLGQWVRSFNVTRALKSCSDLH
jgi:hypothetical protein